MVVSSPYHSSYHSSWFFSWGFCGRPYALQTAPRPRQQPPAPARPGLSLFTASLSILQDFRDKHLHLQELIPKTNRTTNFGGVSGQFPGTILYSLPSPALSTESLKNAGSSLITASLRNIRVVGVEKNKIKYRTILKSKFKINIVSDSCGGKNRNWQLQCLRPQNVVVIVVGIVVIVVKKMNNYTGRSVYVRNVTGRGQY